MTKTMIAMALAALAVLTACEDTGLYPVSNEQCGPSDPVLDLDAADCTVPLPAT